MIVRFTRNFRSNLSALQTFAEISGRPIAYDQVILDLSDRIIPILETMPRIGRCFFSLSATSLDESDKLISLRQQLERLADGAEIREFVMSEHLLLYAIVNEAVYLLPIRHQRQLSFDFAGLWP